jgi:hypothetical protein
LRHDSSCDLRSVPVEPLLVRIRFVCTHFEGFQQQPPLPSLLLPTWGGSMRVAAHCHCPLQPIVTTFPKRIRIISTFLAAAVLPHHPHLLLPPVTTGSVAVDLYWQDQLDRAHSLADKALAPMFPPGMEWAGGEENNDDNRGAAWKRRDPAIKRCLLPPPPQPQPPLPPGPEPRSLSS